MTLEQDQPDLLPTLFERHRPVERYAAVMRGAGIGAATTVISPLDAFLLHQFVAFLPGRPQVLDLAADATGGASAVLWAAHPGVRKVICPPVATTGNGTGGAAAWRATFAAAAAELGLDAGRVVMPASADALEPFAPAVVLAGPTVQVLRTVFAATPDATVLLMPVGRAGRDPNLGPLLGYCADAGLAFTALRDLAPFFHASEVAVVRREGRAEVDEALARVARTYEGNFEFLGMARGLVDAAMRERDLAENDGAAGGAQGGGRRGEGLTRRAYREAIERMRKLVAEKVPAGSTVAVISRGDEELLHLGGRRAWHFPRTEQGVYAGHHPADSAAAVAHLEALREQGADVLMVPVTAFWWMRHYAEFARHLDENCDLLARQDDACALYALRRGEELPAVHAPARVEGFVGRLRHLFGTRRDGTK